MSIGLEASYFLNSYCLKSFTSDGLNVCLSENFFSQLLIGGSVNPPLMNGSGKEFIYVLLPSFQLTLPVVD